MLLNLKRLPHTTRWRWWCLHDCEDDVDRDDDGGDADEDDEDDTGQDDDDDDDDDDNEDNDDDDDDGGDDDDDDDSPGKFSWAFSEAALRPSPGAFSEPCGPVGAA